ncbi:MAG: hypothetical protein GY814_03150 [Gammaproteobacteria bacterium]|nr:hypothetical protein [Gammaproteobacteria bacterium]
MLKSWRNRCRWPAQHKSLCFMLVMVVLNVSTAGFVFAGSLIVSNGKFFIEPIIFGAKGDGITDDTRSMQQAFTHCSKRGLVCRIPSGKRYLVTSPLFLWGDAQLQGEDGTGAIVFDVSDHPYLLNIGISGKNRLEKPFSGVINKIKFVVTQGKGGRIVYFWRTDGAKVTNNMFDVGDNAYSATSSGNDNNWVKNGFKNCIRRNITIANNKLHAISGKKGSEGIGLGHFDGAIIEGNEIVGVGDDPIGVHFSKNIKINNNVLKSVDGRLFVVNSSNVEITSNYHERIRSLKDGLFYKGISLLYIGFETLGANKYSAPTNISVHNNKLYYPPESIDHGAAIYLYGPRNVTIDSNTVLNDSSLVTASALHLLPARFKSGWEDPAGVDLMGVANVWDVVVSNNNSIGMYPRKMIMTGNCSEYKGRILITENAAPNYLFYCDNVVSNNNRIVDKLGVFFYGNSLSR